MKLAYLVALPAALAAPVDLSLPTESLEEITDRYLFFTPSPAFDYFREQQNPKTLDWSSDGCSHAPDNPFGFPFLPACQRHDFGYRNYKAQNRFDKVSRLRIDINFKEE